MNLFSIAFNNFAMTAQLIEHSLDKVELKYGIDLGRHNTKTIDEDQEYYPQIQQDIRKEAAEMAPYYQVFYSLEKTIRRLIVDILETAEGVNWWNSSRIREEIRKNAKSSQKKEIDSGVTQRSDELIDYCDFGELGEIITSNWDVFGTVFSSSSPKAVERVMARLNTLRAPIAHCSLLAEDEIVRLKLTVRDWFRLME